MKIKIILLSLLNIIFTVSVLGQTNERDFWVQTEGPFVANVYLFSSSSTEKIYCMAKAMGIFRSVDSGESWQSLGRAGSGSFVGLTVIDVNHIYLAMPSDGLFHFTDFDNEFKLVDRNSPTNYLTCIVANSIGELLVGTHSEGLYKSTNEGGWKQIGSSLNGKITLLATDSVNGYTYVGTDSLYLSYDSSYSWVNTGLKLGKGPNSLTIDQTGNIYVTTDSGIYIKKNNISWQKIATFRAKKLKINSKGHIFATTSAGVYSSANGGKDWVLHTNGFFYSTQVNSILINLNDDMLVGTDVGLFSSKNNGETWECKNTGLGAGRGYTSTVVKTLFVGSKNQLFVGTVYGGVYKTSDKGESWISLNNGLPNNTFVKHFALNSQNQLFAATHHGIYSLKDNDSTWVKTAFSVNTYSLTINSNDSVFACVYDGLYISADNGLSWAKTSLRNGVYDVSVYTLAISNSNSLWAGTSNGIYISKNNGVDWTKITEIEAYRIVLSNDNLILATDQKGLYRSEDDGENWEKVLDERITSIIITPYNIFYAGSSDYGVYFSSDYGKTWVENNGGLWSPQISSLALDSAGFLYAGTYAIEWRQGFGGGIFKSINPITSVNEDTPLSKEKTILSVSNYPNPFNNSTNIEFNIPHSSKVNVDIFDITGKKVATIIKNKTILEGKHTFRWNTEHISTGIYFCRLIVNNIDTKVQKMIYLK